MGSSDEEGRALGTAEYWNERYAKSDGVHPTHEWFKSFDALETFFAKHLFAQRSVSSKILHLGSGDSTIPRSFAVRGYHNQLCVDFSAKVVEVMRAQDVDMPGIEWQQANVRDMANVGTQSIDVAFDKGTLDAMIYGSPWDPPEDVRSNTTKYIDEVFRVLEDDGVFLYVTFRQPHFIRPLVNARSQWQLDVEVLRDGESTFDYHAFIMRKANG